MIRWIVFDADDTLMDFQKDQREAFFSALSKFGLASKEEYLLSYKKHSETLWKALENGEISKPELLVKRFYNFCNEQGFVEIHESLNETYIEELSNKGNLIPGAFQILKQLSKDYPLALATNGVARIQRGRLACNGIGKFFQHLVISEETGFEKPQRGFFQALMEKIQVTEPKDVLFIGDSLSSDMQGAVNYGMIACWYNPFHKSTDLQIHKEISSLEEIPRVLR